MSSLRETIVLHFVLLTIADQFIAGTAQCPRTNRNPARDCTDECHVKIGCANQRKQCLCDGDCGYSCFNPTLRCSRARRRIRNGRIINSNSNRFNATERTICNSGFKLTGSPLRTCRGNGYWDGKKARCRKPRKFCQDPGIHGLSRRYIPFKANGFKPGTDLSYYCPPKYILVGSRLLTCRSDGTWSAPPPTCKEPTCSQAVLPPNAYVSRPRNWKKRIQYGVRLTLGCNPGYTRPRPGFLVCVTPGWRLNPISFKCFPKSCPDPGRPRNGNRKGLFIFKERVTFTCNRCYKLRGPSYRTCQASQRWSDTQPTCQPAKCARPRTPRYGRFIVTSQWCGGTVKYRCDSGYHLDGPAKRTCQSDETWSGKEPKCTVKSCRDPGRPRNGDRKGSFSVGGTVDFTCDKCYKLKGQSSITCQANQRWSDNRPGCDPIYCGQLPHHRNGRIISKSRQCGAKVEYRCKQGYYLDGPVTRTCQSSGTWSGLPPLCRRRQVTSRPTAKPRTHVVPKPTWMNQSPCGQPNLPSEARITRVSGNYLVVGCKPHFSLVSMGILVCRNKRWETYRGRKIKCLQKGCSIPIVPKHGTKKGLSYRYGDVVTFSCDKCYELKGSSRRICLRNGTWSDSQPSCELKTCPLLQNTNDATVIYNSQNCGATVKYRCTDMDKELAGSGEKKCGENKQWIGDDPRCIEKNYNNALGKPTSQSSFNRKYHGQSWKAVDGNRDPAFKLNTKNSCTHTKELTGSWWRVDLGKQETVAMVIIVNRVDPCCYTRLNDFNVTVGNSRTDGGRTNPVCGGKARPGPGEVIKIKCPNPLLGRFVSVILPKKKKSTLTLCEVEVYRRVKN